MKKIFKRSFLYLDELRYTFAIANILMLLGSITGLLVPTVLGSVFDNPNEYLMYTFILLGVLLISSFVNFLKTRAIGKISNRVAVNIRMDLMIKALKLPHGFFTKTSSGELLSIFSNDVNQFRDALSGGVVYLLEVVVSFIAIIIIMILISPVMTLVLLTTTLVLFYVNNAVSKDVTSVSMATQTSLATLTSLTSQGILGANILKTFRLEQIAQNLHHDANITYEKNSMRLVKIRARVLFIVSIISALQLVLLIFVGMLQLNAGDITIGQLTAFILYAQAISGPLNSASSLVVDVKAAFASIKRVFDILDVEEEKNGNVQLPKNIRGEIEFDNLHFSYCDVSSEVNVLNGVSMKIPAGSTVALVGESGSGKTTLINLMAKLIKPNRGEIFIDGIPLSDVNNDSLYQHVSIVSQQPLLFQLSIRDNIACGNPNAGIEEIRVAAKMANASCFIEKLPESYDTVLGENGMTLSGGQRQRISIARAFLKNSAILLLDEATSSLDNLSEKEIQRALLKLKEGRTTFIIAHRLSTIREADIIFYLHNGEIAASGTHDSLYENYIPYREMYEHGEL